MVEVPLRNGRGAAVVDDEDAERVLAFKWYRHSGGYAYRKTSGRKGPVVLLHRMLLGLELGDKRQCEHINRDRLDCRRANLRIVTAAENNQNVPSRAGASSGFRGVGWDRAAGKWLAYARLNGRQHHLGRYSREEDAAQAAARFRAEHMPFATS